MTHTNQCQNAMQKAVRDALIAFMAATAQAQAEATKEAQRAGIAHAKAYKDEAYLGRKPKFTWQQVMTVRDLASNGTAVAEIARVVGLPRPTVYRIKDNPAETDKLLAKWNLIPRH